MLNRESNLKYDHSHIVQLNFVIKKNEIVTMVGSKYNIKLIGKFRDNMWLTFPVELDG